VTTTQQRRFGFKRWIVIGLIILGGYLAFGLGGIFKPVAPAVVLPGEPVWPGAPITNTLLSTLIADGVLILIALFSVGRFMRRGRLAPSGFYNFFEWLVEFLWNMTESAAGRWAKRVFPVMATIFLLVFTANMVKLLPGFESIGWMKEAHEKGYEQYKLFDLGPLPVYTIDGTKPVETEAEAAPAEGGEADPAEGEHEEEAFCTHACEVVPFLRAAATDLNFTFALAVAAVVMTQVFGFWALGAKYPIKFFNTTTMISKPLFGVIDFLVSLLELVSEFAKIISFGFRLFGNIFAGALLLAILGALTVVIVPSMLYGLEFFVGIIQAYVFSMLALTFMSQAIVSHHGDEHDAEHGHGEHAAEAAH